MKYTKKFYLNILLILSNIVYVNNYSMNYNKFTSAPIPGTNLLQVVLVPQKQPPKYTKEQILRAKKIGISNTILEFSRLLTTIFNREKSK